MRVFVCSLLLITSMTVPETAKAEGLNCKDIAWKARLVMTARQMNGDINKLMADTIREGWPFAKEMVLEAYSLPLETKEERRRLTGAMETFGNEMGSALPRRRAGLENQSHVRPVCTRSVVRTKPKLIQNVTPNLELETELSVPVPCSAV